MNSKNARSNTRSPSSSVKLIFFILSILSVSMPILASRGGQWGRWLMIKTGGNYIIPSSKGRSGKDLAFHPQTNLWPIDAVVYAAVLLLVLYFGVKYFKARQWQKLKPIYVLYVLLPFIWVTATYAFGFNYSNCRLPSEGASCVSPTSTITYTLYAHLIITVLPVLLYLWLKKLFSTNKTAV